jgi:hypothetical protein
MFTIDSPTTILIGLIGVIVLIIILVGIIIALATRRPRTGPAARPNRAAAPARPRLQEILRLWRDPDTGRVVTEFQNRAIRDPRTLNKSELDYLTRLAKDWSTWLSIAEPQPAPKGEASPVAPDSSTVPVSPAAPASVAAETISTRPGTAAPIQANVPVPPVVPPNPAAAAELLQSPTPRSIVQQVDDIVQEKLAVHPAPVPLIKLAEDPYEGVIVWVNTTKYVGIESVTDPVVREIIRSAAVEWEHRTEK